MIYVKQANGWLGFFELNSEIIVIEPINVATIINNTFLMENAAHRWGVYNRNLEKKFYPLNAITFLLIKLT